MHFQYKNIFNHISKIKCKNEQVMEEPRQRLLTVTGKVWRVGHGPQYSRSYSAHNVAFKYTKSYLICMERDTPQTMYSRTAKHDMVHPSTERACYIVLNNISVNGAMGPITSS